MEDKQLSLEEAIRKEQEAAEELVKACEKGRRSLGLGHVDRLQAASEIEAAQTRWRVARAALLHVEWCYIVERAK